MQCTGFHLDRFNVSADIDKGVGSDDTVDLLPIVSLQCSVHSVLNSNLCSFMMAWFVCSTLGQWNAHLCQK